MGPLEAVLHLLWVDLGKMAHLSQDNVPLLLDVLYLLHSAIGQIIVTTLITLHSKLERSGNVLKTVN